MKKCILFILLLIIYTSDIYAQTYKVFKYGEIEGLQNSLVKCLAQDTLGFIWFGTDDGLVRFDGENYVQYTEPQINSRYIKDIICTKNGELIVATDKGIMSVKNNVSSVVFEDIISEAMSEELNFKYPKLMYEDTQGGVWFSGNSSVCHYANKDSIKVYPFSDKDIGNDFKRSFSISETSTDLYVVSFPGYIYRLDKDKNAFEELKIPQNFIANVRHALSIGGNSILLGTSLGLYEVKFTQDGREVASAANISPGYDIHFLKETKDNKLYMGSKSGLYQVFPKRDGQYDMVLVQKSDGPILNYILEDSYGTIWIGTDNGAINIKQNVFSELQSKPSIGFQALNMSKIISSKSGDVFFCSPSMVFVAPSGDPKGLKKIYTLKDDADIALIEHHEKGLFLAIQPASVALMKNGEITEKWDLTQFGAQIADFKVDRYENIWVSIEDMKGVIRVSRSGDIKLYPLNANVTSIYSHFDGSTYFGTNSAKSYLYLYNIKASSLIDLSIKNDMYTSSSAGYFRVEEIAKDKDNTIWLATSVGLMKQERDVINRIDMGKSTVTTIKSVITDDNGDVWFSNSNGMNVLTNNSLLTFTENEGMPSKSVIYRNTLLDSKSRVWAYTDAGICYTSSMIESRVTPRPILISTSSSEELNNDEQENFNFIETGYLSLTYSSNVFPARLVNYQYRIRPTDEEPQNWTLPTKSSTYMVDNVPPGSYVFEVRSKEIGGYGWSVPSKYNIEVVTVWYKRWWVIVLFIVFIMSVPYLSFTYNERRERANRQKLQNLVEKRTNEIYVQSKELKETNKELEDYKNNLEDMVQKRTRQLSVAKNEAESANVAKTQFLANMSHEIRSPLNAIVGFSQILNKEAKVINLKKDFIRYLDNIRVSGQNLSEIINNILDLSKIEANKMSLDLESLNIEQIFKGIYHINKGKAQEKELHFTYDIGPNLPRLIETDRTKLNQVLMNLISNAIKFTSRGKSVTMKVEHISDGSIQFSVEDEGVGISKDNLETIFLPFKQADSTVTRKYGGTGLGLAITKELVTLLGGKIWVESVEGEGSSFFFSLPVEEVDVEQGNDEDALDKSYIFSSENVVLVVEDNQLNQEMVAALFKQINLQFILAENGKIAVEKTMELKPNLILMDMHMPVMDGIEATKKIRAMPEFKHTPIIALSADAFSEQQKVAFEAGVNKYVTKPIDFPKLMPIMAKYLKIEVTEDTSGKLDAELRADMLSEENRNKIIEVLGRAKEIPIYNSKEIIEQLSALRGILTDVSLSTSAVDKIEDIVFDGDDESYVKVLDTLVESLKE